MPLTLTLAGSDESRSVDRGTLSIGRAPGNDWVLSDPERHLSKTHCFIAFAGGRYVLTDISTNGVFINGSRDRITRDAEVVLNDGDQISLGEHVIVVTEVLAGAVPAEPFRDVHTPGPAAASLLGQGGRGDRGVGPGPLDGDPLEDPFGAPPVGGFTHSFAAAPPALRPQDPFDRADEFGQRRAPDPGDDLFHGVTPAEAWQGPSQSDHTDAPDQAFAAPKLVTPMSLDDIDALLGDTPPARGSSAHVPPAHSDAPRQIFVAPKPEAPMSLDDIDALLGDTPLEQAPFIAAPPLQRAAPPLDDPFAELSAAGPPPAASPPPAAAPLSGPPADAARLLAAFLAGAGVPDLQPPGDPESALRDAGMVFRAMVEGLRQVLISRAAIKNEFRVEQSMLRARDNNPLKFAVTDNDAVAALLQPGRPGYKPPLESAHEAFSDVRSHELAVMAGVQTALMGLLRRFEPAALEKRLTTGMLGSILPSARKARTWELFCSTYQQIVREAEDDFQSVFGREFARAYDAQIQKL